MLLLVEINVDIVLLLVVVGDLLDVVGDLLDVVDDLLDVVGNLLDVVGDLGVVGLLQCYKKLMAFLSSLTSLVSSSSM